MRGLRTLAAVALTLPLLLIAGPGAVADTESVKGTGTYKKLVVKNGEKNLVFVLTAPGGKCDIKYLQVKFRDKDGTKFAMDGGCYGIEWAASLVKGDTLKDCKDFTLKYAKADGKWTGTIPRSCLKGLGGAVKVTYSYVDDYSGMPGEVDGTGYVKQG